MTLRRALALLAALCLGLLLARTMMREPSPREDGRPERRPSIEAGELVARVEPALASVEALHEEEMRGVDAAQAAGSAREPQSAESLTLVTASGAPIAGASVSLTPLRPELLAGYLNWTSFDLEPLLAASVLAESDDEGQVRFERAGAEEPRVVWVTHQEHLAASFVLEAGERLGRRRLVLVPARGLEVRVRRRDGGPVEGARLTQLFRAPGAPAPLLDERRTSLEQSFARRFEVPASGLVRVARLEGEQALFAEQGELRSEGWTGEAAAQVELVLGLTITVGGLVRLPPETSSDRLAVLCMASEESGLRAHALVGLHADGSWGPQRLPLPAVREYRFELRGESILTETERIEEPRPGASYRVDFEARKGMAFVVEVVDEREEPLPGATVETFVSSNRRERAQSRVSDSEGRARFRIEPTGELEVRARAQQRRSVARTLIDQWSERPEPLRLVLARAGVLRGRCTHEGQPLQDFTIFCFERKDPQECARRFEGREDGDFEIAEAPLGEVLVVAWAEGFAPTEPLAVVVPEEGVAEVQIELSSGLEGTGRVVDARTGEPVEDAIVYATLEYAGRPFGNCGGGVTTGSDGSFRLGGLRRGENVVWVWHASYAPAHASVVGLPGAGAIEVGLVQLVERRSLQVRLLSEHGTDFRACRASLFGTEHHPLQRFDEEGRTVFEGVAPGNYLLTVHVGEDTTVRIESSFQPGSPDEILLPLECAGHLRVEAVPRPGQALPEGAMVALRRGAGDFILEQWRYLPPSGVLELTACVGVGSMLSVLDGEFRPLGGVVLDRETFEARSVRIPLDPRLGRLRVVDGSGAPVVGAPVVLLARDGLTDWWFEGVTQAGGSCEVPLVPEGELVAVVRHELHGLTGEHPLRASELLSGSAEIVLDPRARIALQVRDGATPLAGARVVLSTSLPYGVPCAELFTDAEGHAARELVAEGRYRCRVLGPGLWPAESELRASPGASPTEVQVRRQGGLVLVASRLGNPAQGVRFDLDALELSGSVVTWLAEGRIQASRADLSTDAEGRLRLEGLPRGRYAWRAFRESELVASGELEVPPSALGRTVIALP